MISTRKQAAAAAAFAEQWQGKGYEKGESQTFWLTLLREVFDVEHPEAFIRFEEQVKLDTTSFIDAHIPSTKVMIEQKSLGKSLTTPILQSNGSALTPYQQAQRYILGLPLSQHPRWVVTCNFAEFLIYDMERPNAAPQQIFLKDLGREYYRLQFLVEQGNEHLQREKQVSLDAGRIVGEIYDAFHKQYIDPTKPESMRSLNVLCVRLVFCLYAEDAGIFGKHDMFHDFLAHYATADTRNALIRLFDTLDTPLEERDPYLQDDLASFPYANGGLFHGHIEIPRLTDEIRDLLLTHASQDFDWSLISPTIFGAVFESTLNPETRRSGGMHYTSIENIHKVIDPLFLDSLKEELEEIKEVKVEKVRRKRLQAFQEKLSELTFLDPACGSGNFLTETYLSLRRLENEVIRMMYHGQSMLGAFINPVRVSIQQFHGIEINDFAVTVATTALWISEAQMLTETERIVRHDIDFLPLRSYSNIREGNALRMEWDEVVPRESLHYIIGNPPFGGYVYQSNEQKEDLRLATNDVGNNIDYVAGWYFKAAEMIKGNHVRVAFVSTNSITQGEQVAVIWKPLYEHYGIHIDFAHRTFQWDSEASDKAHVHCVIIGFSVAENNKPKFLYDNNTKMEASNINPYLTDAPDVFIERRPKPLSDVSCIFRGSQPTDDGNLILTEEEKNELINKEPQAKKYIRPFMMGKDFINRKPRYCIWLVHAKPNELKQCPLILKRVEKVRDFRLISKKAATRGKAKTPTLFDENHECMSDYIAIPVVSSENRRYIPMDYLRQEVIAGNKLFMMPNATLYHFGVLESNVHMAWMRVVCGRLKSDYSYSNTIVYNNFPWPTPTEGQRLRIERTAQAILNARDRYPDSSLADLYDPVAMPPELITAHQENDRAVMQAYGFTTQMKEPECVAALFQLYRELVVK